MYSSSVTHVFQPCKEARSICGRNPSPLSVWVVLEEAKEADIYKLYVKSRKCKAVFLFLLPTHIFRPACLLILFITSLSVVYPSILLSVCPRTACTYMYVAIHPRRRTLAHAQHAHVFSITKRRVLSTQLTSLSAGSRSAENRSGCCLQLLPLLQGLYRYSSCRAAVAFCLCRDVGTIAFIIPPPSSIVRQHNIA